MSSCNYLITMIQCPTKIPCKIRQVDLSWSFIIWWDLIISSSSPSVSSFSILSIYSFDIVGGFNRSMRKLVGLFIVEQ